MMLLDMLLDIFSKMIQYYTERYLSTVIQYSCSIHGIE